VIGLELGWRYQKAGSAITVVTDDARSCPVPIPTAPRSSNAEWPLGREDLQECQGDGYETQKDGSLAVRIEVVGKQVTIETIASWCGRYEAQFEGSRTRKGRSQIDERGFVPTDKFGRTSVPSIYASATSAVRLCRAQASKESRDRPEVIAGQRLPKIGLPSRRHLPPIPRSPRSASLKRSQREGHRGSDRQDAVRASGPRWRLPRPKASIKIVADKKTHQIVAFTSWAVASRPHQRKAPGARDVAFLEDVVSPFTRIPRSAKRS